MAPGLMDRLVTVRILTAQDPFLPAPRAGKFDPAKVLPMGTKVRVLLGTWPNRNGCVTGYSILGMFVAHGDIHSGADVSLVPWGDPVDFQAWDGLWTQAISDLHPHIASLAVFHRYQDLLLQALKNIPPL